MMVYPSEAELKMARLWRLEKCGSLDFKDLFKKFGKDQEKKSRIKEEVENFPYL